MVFDPLPDSNSPISGRDQEQMWAWNQFADVFRVYATPSSYWAWGNDRFDIAGFVSNEVMVAKFGQGWGSNTLGVTYLDYDTSNPNSLTLEADIALNPAFNWTTDDFATYNNPNLHNANHTLLHEIGHAWGLEHQWNALSVMNYAPHKYRAYTVMYVDDTKTLRSSFPARASVNVQDLGVSLFHSSGEKDYDDATLDTNKVTQGTSFTVSDFVIENLGVFSVAPEIEWYLVPKANSWTDPRFLMQSTHVLMSAETSLKTSQAITVPETLPAGEYYLGAYIRIPATGEAQHINNSSWLDSKISIVPKPPGSINASQGDYNGKVRVSWSKVVGATSYEIYRCSDNTTPSCVSIATSTATNYDDSAGIDDTYHHYRVKARAETGSSGFSNSVSGIKYALAPFPIPGGLSASDGTHNDRIIVSWNGVGGADSYLLYWCSSEQLATCGSANYQGPGMSYNYLAGANGLPVYFRVRACHPTNGCSSHSDYEAGYVQSPLPSPPGGMRATTGSYGKGSVHITWNTPSGATRYKLYRCTSPSTNTCSEIYSGKLSQYTDRSTLASASHYYRAKACHAGGCSAFSDHAIFATPGPPFSPPKNVTASDGVYTDRVRISWEAVNNAFGYRVLRCTSTQINSCSTIFFGSVTSHDDTPAAVGTKYYYRVQSCGVYSTNCGAHSDADTGYRVQTLTPPPAPGGLSASDGTYVNRVRVKWNAVNSATYYKGFWCADLTLNQCLQDYSGNAPTFDHAIINPEGEEEWILYFRAKACNSGGCSPFSSYDSGFSARSRIEAVGAVISYLFSDQESK